MHPADLISPRNLLIAVAALLLAPKGQAAEPPHAAAHAPLAHAQSAVSPDTPSRG